jgi:hypothetical protein
VAGVAGVVATAVGAGIGIGHLQQSGVSAESIIGLCFLAALVQIVGAGSRSCPGSVEGTSAGVAPRR